MYSPEERTAALYYYFGWQGGTVHQLSSETGLSVMQILHDDLELSDNINIEESPVRKNGVVMRRFFGEKNKGDFSYWSNVIHSFYALGPVV